MPRAGVPAAPHATTVTVAVPAGALDMSASRVKSIVLRPGSKSWKSFSASPTNSSTRPRGTGAVARPCTVSVPLMVAPGPGRPMTTEPVSASVVGQVLGMAPAGGAPAAPTAARATTSAPSRARTVSGTAYEERRAAAGQPSNG